MRSGLGRSAVLVGRTDEKHLVPLHPPRACMHVRRVTLACNLR